MRISRENQQTLAYAVLRLLARGICAVSMYDKRVAAEIEALGDGFSFALYTGMRENAPGVGLRTENGRFSRTDADIDGFDVVIRFKDVTGMLPVLFGRISVASAFAHHRMLVWGSINRAVALVRIINITEAYLFPEFVIKKIMRSAPKKQVPGFLVYVTMLFFKPKGMPRAPGPGDKADESIVFAEAADTVELESMDEENEAAEGLEAVK